MTGAHVLTELVIVLGTAAVVTLVFHLVRLPVVLGYIAAGLVIGPHVPVPLVASPDLVAVLSELGVILLMFAVGLELRLSTLARVGIGAGLTSLFEVALALTASALVARALGASSTEALFTGACFSISSTMLVAKAFEDKGWKGGFTDVVFALLVFEDLIAIALLAILTGVASGSSLGATDLAVTLGKLALFLAVALVAGLLVVPRIVRFVARLQRDETLLIVALALCFGFAIVTEHFHYPVALGAFLAGLLVAESGLGHRISDLVRPFRDVFAAMFFMSIGMTIVPDQLANNIPEILLFSAIVLVVKPLGVTLGSFGAGRGLHSSLRAGVSLAQTGELSFIIAGIGLSAGVVSPDLLAIAVGVLCVTTLASSLLIARSDGIATVVSARIPSRIATFLSFYESWLGRLRGRELVTWPRLRRPVFVLVADVIASVLIVFVAKATSWLALAAIVPFAISTTRRIASIARVLAETIIPAVQDGLDLGRAPRRSLRLSLELAISAAIAIPTIAIIEPLLGTPGVIVLTALLVLLAVVYRSLLDFDQHVRAGSELILELMRQPEPEPVPLPGFEGLVSVTIPATALAIGRSLADLDLRARTGASVLAIRRGDGGFATPAPSEPLAAGDTLALAGSEEAIALARESLQAPNF